MDTRNPATAGATGAPGAGTRPDARTGPPHGATPENDPQRAQQQMRQAGSAAADAARGAARDVKDRAGEVADQAKQTAAEVAEQTRRKAGEYASQAMARGHEVVDQQKQKAAEQLQTFSAAAHRAADKFREERDDNIAGYVDAVADEIDRCANYLRQHDARGLVRDAQEFGRRRPEWFLGGMFVAGLALTRFLKASADRGREQQPFGGARPSSGMQHGYAAQSQTHASGQSRPSFPTAAPSATPVRAENTGAVARLPEMGHATSGSTATGGVGSGGVGTSDVGSVVVVPATGPTPHSMTSRSSLGSSPGTGFGTSTASTDRPEVH